MGDDIRAAGPIGIIGGGSIGVAFALVFARAGFTVRVQDPDAARRAAVSGEVRQRLLDLKGYGLIEEDPDGILARITVVASLAEAVSGATLIQECAPEQLALKCELFAELDRLAPA